MGVSSAAAARGGIEVRMSVECYVVWPVQRELLGYLQRTPYLYHTRIYCLTHALPRCLPTPTEEDGNGYGVIAG
jgi:hypothetical protein